MKELKTILKNPFQFNTIIIFIDSFIIIFNQLHLIFRIQDTHLERERWKKGKERSEKKFGRGRSAKCFKVFKFGTGLVYKP